MELNESELNSLWANNKNNLFYEILGVATNKSSEQDGERMVIYRRYDGETNYVRELTEFRAKFKKVDNESK